MPDIANNPNVFFESELSAIPNGSCSEEPSHVLSFALPSSIAAQISESKQSLIALSETSESLVFRAETRVLASAVFNKHVAKLS